MHASTDESTQDPSQDLSHTLPNDASQDRRIRFDFEVEFTNGGGLQGQDFRLDLHGDDMDDAALAEAGAALVGIDSFNIDDTVDGKRPVHTALLGVGIPIVEHLCGLAPLPAAGFRFSAVPVKVRGLGTFPVRAYATIPD